MDTHVLYMYLYSVQGSSKASKVVGLYRACTGLVQDMQLHPDTECSVLVHILSADAQS